MSISHIEATKFFDEVRAHFGSQARPGKAIELVIQSQIRSDGSILIGYFDGNNLNAKPLFLMINENGSGRNWANQIGSGIVFNIVNQALLAFDDQKKEWISNNHNFSREDSLSFLINFMKQVSSYLR